MPTPRARTASLLALALCAATLEARGNEPSPSDLVRAYRSADATSLARVAAAMPESALGALIDRGDLSERRAAVYAARFARDPLALVAPLARAMSAGDPELSPAAARALLAMMDARENRLEHSESELRAALSPALSLADATGVRPDLAEAARALRAWVE